MEVQGASSQVALPGLEQPDMPTGKRYTCHAKQVKCLGEHFADCISSDAASRATTALNSMDVSDDYVRLLAELK